MNRVRKRNGFGLAIAGKTAGGQKLDLYLRRRIPKILASSERCDISQALKSPMDSRQRTGRYENINIGGGSIVTVSNQRHPTGNRVRDAKLFKLCSNRTQRLVNRIIAHKKPACRRERCRTALAHHGLEFAI